MRTARRLLTGGAAPGPSRALAIVLLVTSFLAAAAPRVLEVFQTRVLQKTLAAAPPADRAIAATSGWVVFPNGQRPGQGGSPPPGQLAATAGRLSRGLPAPLTAQPGSAWDSVTTPVISVLNPAPAARPGMKDPQLEIVYRSPVRSHLRLVAGTLPDRASTGLVAGRRVPVLDVAVTTATAARFGLHAGSDIRIGTQPAIVLHATGPPAAVLHVVGVVRPADPAAAFWAYDQLVAAPDLQDVFSTSPGPFWAGSALIGPAELGALPSLFRGQQLGLVWDVPLRLGSLTAAGVPRALGALAALRAGRAIDAAAAGYPAPLTIGANPEGILGPFPAQEAAADQILSLTITGLFLIGLVLIGLAARLIVERRDAELAALRARGSSLRGLALRILADTGPLLVASLAAGIAVAVIISPGGSVSASWQMTAVLGAAALAGPPLLAMLRHADSATSRRAARADVTIPRRSSRRVVAEVSAVVATAGVVAALRYRAPGAGDGVNLLTGTGPQLVALLAALLAIRCYPLPLRMALRLAARRRGAAGYLGLARAARSAPTALLPALALILAMALAGFGGMVQATVTNARVADSWRQVGADATVTVTDINPLPAAAARRLARVSGVRHSVTVSDEPGQLVIGGQTAGTTAVDADPVPYAALSADTPFGSFAPSLLGSRGRPAGGSAGPDDAGRGAAADIPVLVSPGLAHLTGRTGQLKTGADRPLRVRVAGVLPGTPAVASGSFVIVPAWAANRDDGPWPVNRALLTGAHLDSAALAAISARSIPGGTLHLRAAVLARAVAASPMASGTRQLFALCLAAAALLAAAAVILGFALSADSRQRLLVNLTTLGLRSRQASAVAVLEALPLLVVAVAGGLVAALALPVAIGPVLNLAVFVGTGPAVTVQPGLLPLAAAAAGTAVIVIVTALCQSAAATRGGIAAALRKGEDP